MNEKVFCGKCKYFKRRIPWDDLCIHPSNFGDSAICANSEILKSYRTKNCRNDCSDFEKSFTTKVVGVLWKRKC